MTRNTSTLRDILFDEIEQVRTGGDTKRAVAIAKLAQQVISTAKVEMDFHKLAEKARESGRDLTLGSMDLGERKNAVHVASNTTPTTIEYEKDDDQD